MVNWSGIGKGIVEFGTAAAQVAHAKTFLDSTRNIARRDLRDYAKTVSTDDMLRMARILDNLSRTEQGERADLAAELAEYAEQLAR